MHTLTINSVKIHEIADVVSIRYPLFSYANIYKQRAVAVEKFRKRNSTSRDISITLKFNLDCLDPIKLQHEIEKKIETIFKTDETFIEVDNRYFYGVLDSVDNSEMYTQLLTLNFKDLKGHWFSEEKEIEVSENLSLKTDTVVNYESMIFELTPVLESVTIQVGFEKLFLKPKGLTTAVADYWNKEVKQSGNNVEILEDSKWGTLKQTNTIKVLGATGKLKYREILA